MRCGTRGGRAWARGEAGWSYVHVVLYSGHKLDRLWHRHEELSPYWATKNACAGTPGFRRPLDVLRTGMYGPMRDPGAVRPRGPKGSMVYPLSGLCPGGVHLGWPAPEPSVGDPLLGGWNLT